jgi:hypothetical protein
MFSRITTCLLAACLCVGLCASRAGAVATATFDLQQTSLTPAEAQYNVFVTFVGDTPMDTIEGLQLSVHGSDVGAGTLGTGDNFSRFGFATSVAGWQQFIPLSTTGTGLFGPTDPIAGPFVDATGVPQSLGTLSVDLTGIPAGTSILLSIANDDAMDLHETDVFGTVDGQFVTSFRADANGEVLFTQPEGVQFDVPEGDGTIIPEPVSALWLPAIALVAMRVRRRRAL